MIADVLCLATLSVLIAACRVIIDLYSYSVYDHVKCPILLTMPLQRSRIVSFLIIIIIIIKNTQT